MLSKWLVTALLLASAGGDLAQARSVGQVSAGEGKQRDLFDQLIHNLAGKYFPGGGDGTGGLQWTVHPLPRKRQLNLSPSIFGGGGGDDDSGDAPNAGGGGGGGNAMPSSILAAAASAGNTASPSASDSASATGNTDRSSATASNTPASSASSIPPASTSAAPSSSAVPLSKIITSNSASSTSSPSTTSSSSSTSTASPTSTSSPSSDQPLLSPKNKFFPLVITGLAAAGLVALMMLIAIARCLAHDQLRRDNLKKSYGFDDSSPKDRFTSAPIGAARSIRRALTKKKQLGSFARRTQDGSVLIEVGDEVFAVPAHLADSYRERILREKRSRSDLSSESNGFGVKAKYLSDGGPDGDEEQARMKYDAMLDGEGGGVRRSLSQRLSDRLRSLTGGATEPVEEKAAFSFASQNQQTGAMRQSDLTARQGALTQGAPGWSITQRQSSAGFSAPKQPKEEFGTAKILPRTNPPRPPVLTPAPTAPTQPLPAPTAQRTKARKPPPKLELSLLTSKLAELERLPASSSLTHSSRASANGTFGAPTLSTTSSSDSNSIPGAFPERTKSLHRSKTKPSDTVGTYRHRPSAAVRSKTHHNRDSTALGSPTRFTHESHRIPINPEKPQPAKTADKRPLPVPPPFSLPK
ncbi:hypothetical protein PHBOTO_003327 [Pseudozyma hubeiensis]|nr:hypothetical protein PHBOTO_003327 [Pseudozyma hubeiensis]